MNQEDKKHGNDRDTGFEDCVKYFETIIIKSFNFCFKLSLPLSNFPKQNMAGLRGKKHGPHLVEHDRSHEDGKQFDLLPSSKKDDIFRVAFDYYSPRPHFIIVPRDRKSVTNYNSLNPEEKLKIVKAAMEMVSHYNLQKSTILSLHFGRWGTEKNNFHAHVCVDVNEYLSIFEQKKDKIPNWPSPKYVTKEWKASKDHRHYAINVQKYPFKTYFEEEVKAIKDYRRTKPSTSTAGASAIPFPPFTALLYHPSDPKVGFAVEKSVRPRSAEALLEAQLAIIKFADRNKLTDMDAKDEDDGCHVCLILDEKAHG